MQGIWAGARSRVEALAGRPGAAEMFGASGHGFALDAPLTREQLVDWETRVGATLPTPYRSFLTEVAAAGAGPYYGLLGFRVVDGIAHWVGDKWRGRAQLNLRVAFPHRDAFQPDVWPQFDALAAPEQFPTPADHAEAVRRRAELVQALEDWSAVLAHTWGQELWRAPGAAGCCGWPSRTAGPDPALPASANPTCSNTVRHNGARRACLTVRPST